jgi:hypothetical protein
MRRASLKIAEGRIADHDDRTAMTQALNRLYGAASQSVDAIVANLSPSERAKLAVFCYGRVHLNAIDLAIAASCDLDHLVAASHSATAGRALLAQSREIPMPERPVSGRRTITLATSVRPLVSRAARSPVKLTS